MTRRIAALVPLTAPATKLIAWRTGTRPTIIVCRVARGLIPAFLRIVSGRFRCGRRLLALARIVGPIAAIVGTSLAIAVGAVSMLMALLTIATAARPLLLSWLLAFRARIRRVVHDTVIVFGVLVESFSPYPVAASRSFSSKSLVLLEDLCRVAAYLALRTVAVEIAVTIRRTAMGLITVGPPAKPTPAVGALSHHLLL